MDSYELSGIWKVVSWILTAIIMFLLGMVGIIIADAIGSDSKFYAYGGFFIGWSSYPLIKSILLRLTHNDSINDIVDNEYIQYTTDDCEFSEAQRITHELRKSTLCIPFAWKYYLIFVKKAMGETDFDNQYQSFKQNPKFTDDYCLELIGANYAKDHIFNDVEWSNNLRQEIAKNNNNIDGIRGNILSHIKEIEERLHNANDSESNNDFITITARIGARKLWADMFEYSYKSEINKI